MVPKIHIIPHTAPLFPTFFINMAKILISYDPESTFLPVMGLQIMTFLPVMISAGAVMAPAVLVTVIANLLMVVIKPGPVAFLLPVSMAAERMAWLTVGGSG